MDYTIWELFIFLRKIRFYEEELYSAIKKQLIYTFKDRKELLYAVNMYKNKDSKQLAIKKYYLISLWDTSNITDMSYLFYYDNDDIALFNEDISLWDVSNVETMNYMFLNCSRFDQPLKSWNVENVNTMKGMFEGCHVFNQPLDLWNVKKVIKMNYMFAYCFRFYYSLNSWKLSNTKKRNMWLDTWVKCKLDT